LEITKTLEQKLDRCYREDLWLDIKSDGALDTWVVTERNQTPFGLHERTIPTCKY